MPKTCDMSEKLTILSVLILVSQLGNRAESKILMLSTLGKIFSRALKYFLIFPRIQVLTFHANYMKCCIPYSGKNKKNVIVLSSAIAQRVVKVKCAPETILLKIT